MIRKIFLPWLLILFADLIYAQQDSAVSHTHKNKDPRPGIGLGLKVGTNFANVTNASDINASNTTGFHIGLFYAPSTGHSLLGYRTEIIYSRQGYNYANGAATGNVKLDYILLPQLMTINITRFFEIHAGFQMAFLINAKADSSKTSASNNPYGDIMDYYNRFDYGVTGGIQVNPILGLFVGARYNLSLSNMYKESYYTPGNVPPFIPSTDNINLKNNVIQLYAGWKF